MQGVRAPTEKMSRSLSFSRPCYSGLLSVGLVALLLGVNHAFARFVDVIRNDISLPEDVDAGDAKPADIDGDGDIDFVIQDFAIVPGGHSATESCGLEMLGVVTGRCFRYPMPKRHIQIFPLM